MLLRSLVVGALLALTALPAAAQSALGRWVASVETESGSLALVFEFLLDDAGKLAGSMENEFTGAIPIQEGELDGDELTFKLVIEGPEGAMTINYKGAVDGDELKLTSAFEGTPPGGAPAEQTLTATREE